MRSTTTRAIGACLLLAGLLAPAASAAGFSHRETSSHEFQLAEASGRRTLIVDTVWGSIRVRGRADAGDTVTMTLTRRIEAASEQWLDRARSEVELEVFAEPGSLELFVDGPWRDRRNRREWARDAPELEYEVIYDFVLEVPTGTDLRLENVLEGNIEIAAVTGRHDVSNVTGDIHLDGVRGSGRFKSVSGSISGTFAGQPGGSTRWETVSGDLDIGLAPEVDADLLLASRWGEIWSAFKLAPLPAPPAKASTRKGSFVIKTNQGARFRVGSGGPELHFETLSGDIRIRKNEGD